MQNQSFRTSAGSIEGSPLIGPFLILTGEPDQDVIVPGAGYSFGKLQLALALGEFDSLESHRKYAIRLHLPHAGERGSLHLEQAVQQALGNIRRRAG